MKQFLFYLVPTLLLMAACKHDKIAEASGNFEADEVLVSAEQGGKILSLNVKEGDTLPLNAVVGQIDITPIELQKEQVEASIKSLQEKTTNAEPQLELVKKQLAVQESQLAQMEREKTRTEKLLAADAVTRKQLDDINSSIDQLHKAIEVSKQQLNLYQSNIATQNRSILSEASPMQKTAERYQDQINRGKVINPIKGTVLVKYAYAGEVTFPGKPLYSIANLDTITLKAYVTGTQLPTIKLNQQVTVHIDGQDNKSYPGTIYWISGKSEFTPKNIQTQDERENLVYAVKIRVKNDGFLKLGMYAEVDLP